MKISRLLCVLFFSCAAPLLADEGVTVTVTVTNIPGVKGDLLIGLYPSAESFTDEPMEMSPKITLTSKDDVVSKIPNVPPGTYAIAVIQDLNQNGILDKNILGMPKEPLAFSVIREIPKGKPDFSACSFEVKDVPVALTIPLKIK